MALFNESDACMRARLVESLSQSFPGSALSKALQAMNDEELDQDPLSSSCFAELRLEKGSLDEEEEEEDDEELTSLSWLQDTDLLKNLSTGDHSLCASPSADDMQKENSLNGGVYGQTHPPHVPYNPQKHINSKPPYSFSCLIFMAIEDSPIKKLPVKDIYNWILSHFPYFRNAPTGWKNSVRHNLSLNKCFKKVEKEKGHGLGKGSLWCIDPIYRPNLLQALRKTPYHPYHQLQMLSNPQPPAGLYTIHGVIPPGGSRPLPLAPKLNINTPSPHLFPFLSKRLSQSGAFDSGTLGESDIDVANTLVALKRSRQPFRCRDQRSRSPSPPEFGSEREKELLKKIRLASKPKAAIVCTAPPSDDHTYSVVAAQLKGTDTGLASPGSSIDEEYDFGNDDEDDEDDGWGHDTKRIKNRCDLDRSHSDMECSNSDVSDTDFDEGGSDGEHPSRVRGLIVKINSRKRKRKSSAPVPLYKKRMVDTDEEEDEKERAGAAALLNLASAALSMPNINNNNYSMKPVMEIKQEPLDE